MHVFVFVVWTRVDLREATGHVFPAAGRNAGRVFVKVCSVRCRVAWQSHLCIVQDVQVITQGP